MGVVESHFNKFMTLIQRQAFKLMNMIQSHLKHGVAALIAGQPLIFPTDTVYGLGVAVGIVESPALLFDIKERDHAKPVAWLVANAESLNLYGKDVPAYATMLARSFWPGPLTIIVKADTNVRKSYRAKDGTIALRMPDNKFALQLIECVGVPLATTSANISGQEPPCTFEEIDTRLLEKVSVVLRDNGKRTGVASTVVDCTGEKPVVVREGSVSAAAIQSLVLMSE